MRDNSQSISLEEMDIKHYRSLKVIWRSLGESKSNLISAIDSESRKSIARHITCPQIRFGKCFQVIIGQLKAFGGHFEVTCLIQTQI